MAEGNRVIRGISELYTPFERFENAAMVVGQPAATTTTGPRTAGSGTAANGIDEVEVGEQVVWVGPERELPPEHKGLPGLNLGGRGVLPGFVDSHNHLIWAGSRVEEFVRRSAGADYEDILAAGGGIMATVRDTRAASEARLTAVARRRVGAFLRGGVTTLEIKSGYGLDTENELKMLRVARRLQSEGPQRVTTTLLAHVPDPDVDRDAYVERFVSETIPEAARLRLADTVDVFCDRQAFDLPEARRILEAGLAAGLQITAHAEQLSHTGVALLIAELHGLSADHLEQATAEDFAALAAAGAVATILPGAAVGLGLPLPPASLTRPSGVRVAIASDHNPGSSPHYGLLPSMQLATALGGYTVEEALIGASAHAADALGQPTWGRLAPGSPADYLVVDGPAAMLPLYSWGHSRLHEMVIGGHSVWRRDG